MSTKNKIGPIVEGQDFVGRIKEQEDAWELLENGHSLILAAPRRVGKSSFSKKMIVRAKDNGSIDTVEKAYSKLVNSTYFNTWEERLSYYPEEETDTRLILNELSKSKNGISRNGLQVLIYNKTNDEEKSETILTQLLFKLKNDGYIMFDEKGKKYLFRSPLLRDFWYNRFIK